MTMEILSVLLIVGSAVVGPIEAQPTGRCVANAEYPLLSRCERETLPELCERAMREVGNTMPLIGYVNGHSETRGYFGAVGKESALCLPTPKGYRR